LVMACKSSCWFRYVLDFISIPVECLIQVYCCEIVYWMVLFDIDSMDHYSWRVWLQVPRNGFGDDCLSPGSSEIYPTYRHDCIAIWRWLHTLYNILVFCSATSAVFSSTWKYISEHLRSTSFCIQPFQEPLEASGMIGVAVQTSWVIELSLPNYFKFWWCVVETHNEDVIYLCATY
jgi:hypothetical protein